MKAAFTDVDPSRDPMGSLLDQYMDDHQCRHGDIVEGIVASVTPRAILIDIGGKCDATVLPHEVERMTPVDLQALKPGKEVSVYVIDPADDAGTMLVSLARAAQQSDWESARKLMQNGETATLPVIDTNKGGVIVRLNSLRGFVPGSLLHPKWRAQQDQEQAENRWAALMGESLTLRVIEVTPERNRLILSERPAAGNKALKHKILQQLEVGATYKGIVSNIVPFGAFVNIKGMDGLLHISEFSWKRVTDPAAVLQVGQEVEVCVLEVDLERERLGLSLKQLAPDPWETVTEDYTEGQEVEVEIVNLTSFGAFAALVDNPNIEGLIHISELSAEDVSRPQEVVKVGDLETVQIISLRPEERRIAFSLKRVDDEADTDAETAPVEATPAEAASVEVASAEAALAEAIEEAETAS